MAFRMTFQLCRSHHTIPVAIILQAFFILITLLAIELGYLSGLKQMLKDFLLQDTRTLHQRSQITNRVEPLVKQSHQFCFCLGEFRHLQIDESQFIIEYFLSVRLHEFHFVIIRRGTRGKTKVQDTNRIDSL